MVELHEAVEKMMSCKQSKALLIRSRTAPFCSGADLELVKKVSLLIQIIREGGLPLKITE